MAFVRGLTCKLPLRIFTREVKTLIWQRPCQRAPQRLSLPVTEGTAVALPSSLIKATMTGMPLQNEESLTNTRFQLVKGSSKLQHER